ncbi:SDR family NAD(P)-dependent oxidoreductase [Streptomyces puniciscabiei]
MAADENKLRDYLKRATTDLARTRRRLAALEERAAEPIAIVGMACRYPGGVTSPEELWRLVADGVDATGDFPVNRGWDLDALFAPEGDVTSYVRRGGFLYTADEFDAPFFGISPREALAMDPQQRLLLETAWEGMERARIDPAGLRGSDTGVFVGVMAGDYGPRLDEPIGGTDGHLGTGTHASVTSGRVSYAFGFTGPALSVDTACSSSLVALHLAVQSLRRGECSLALAGGATVMSGPGSFVEGCRQQGLAPDGRCKPFSAAADGTAWGEGVGLVVVERLSDARRHGHPVLALIRGTAVNQDGASNGLTAPNGPSQEKVIRQALAAAGLSPDGVDAVEAHGTGTKIGDPLEAAALIATYGQDRPADRPLLLGSLKSNVGHTQAAAGVGGVIKMVMAMRHGTVPASLHLDEATPYVDWSDGTVLPLGESRSWPETGRPRRAAVSSFGMSGTNAHVVLEEATEIVEESAEELSGGGERHSLPVVAWPLSGRSPDGLAAQAARLCDAVAGTGLSDVATSLAVRTALDHRAVVIGSSAEELTAGLTAVADGTDPDSAVLVRGIAGRARTRNVFVFPGQGAQWAGMGVELLDSSPVFAAAIADCEAALGAHVDWSLTDVLRAAPESGLLERVDVVQPVSFAVMIGLARLWMSAGVRPTAVIGHSQGEIAAAHIAGALTLDQAAAVVALRSRALTELAGAGGMVSVPLAEREVAALLADRSGRLATAAVNGPSSTVVSGDAEAVEEFLATCEERGVQARRIPVDYASHSHHVERIEHRLATLLDSITAQPARIPVYSSVTGEPPVADLMDGAYWYRNLRRQVRFEEAVRSALAAGHDAFIEVSPHPVVTVGITQTAEDAGADVAVATTLRRDQGDGKRLLTAFAEAFTAGVSVDWAAVHAGGRPVPLPTYAFQRQRYWLDRKADGGAQVTGAGLDGTGHPLLTAAVAVAGTEQWLLTGRLSLHSHPWLADHTVDGTVLLPGTAFAELAVRAGDQADRPIVDELTVHTPLLLAHGEALRLQVWVEAPEADGRRHFTVSSCPDGTTADSTWTRHASGALATGPNPPAEQLAAWPPSEARPTTVSDLYDRLDETGYGYGPAFRGLRQAWQSGNDLYAEVELPDPLTDQADRFGLHPALFDAALHTLRASDWFARPDGGSPVLLPFAWSGVRLHASGASRLRVRLRRTGPDEITVLAADTAGAPVLTVDSLRLREAHGSATAASAAPRLKSLYEVEWSVVAEEPAEGARLDGTPLPDGTSVVTMSGAASVREAVVDALTVVRDWLGAGHGADARLVMVTRGAVAAGPADRAPAPAQAAVWGLLRSAQSEHPERFVLLDTDEEGDEGQKRSVTAALAADQPQLALRQGKLLAPRLTAVTGRGILAAPPKAGTWRLEATGGGTPDGLALVPYEAAKRPLAAEEVRIAVRAAGLNFRDVLISLGMVEHQAGLGWELAGEVLEVGSEVTGLAPGDRVMGLAPGDAFASMAVTDVHMLARVPQGWSYVRAASVPLAYLTAYYGLVDLADLKAGESVLIHAAAGGVGMAAVQIAQHLGAEVFGTASLGKWATLRAQGLDEEHIANSRDLHFENRVLHATGGRGVNVVLNSFSGEFVDASLRTLATGGRFVEMGKTDIRDADEVAALYPGVHYQAFDLREAGPVRMHAMLAQVLRLFDEGVLTPLPVSTWDVRRAPEAFHYLSRARHVGKVVLTVPKASSAEGTVLVTGATGTLGRLVARHLVTEHGARHLLLVGRRGTAAEGMPEFAAELRELGASVTVAACDVTDRDALSGLLADMPAAHPLTSVIHAAGVLDDGVVEQLTPERLERVIGPKIEAALVLDELTTGIDLENFVLFSSAAGVVGNPGQANYAAANAALDALAERRRAAGRPALSLAWGLWAPASGMTGHLTETELARLAREGSGALTAEEGLALFDAAMASGRTTVVPARLGTARLPQPVPHLLRGLVRGSARRTAARSAAATDSGLVERLAALTEAERAAHVLELVREEASRVLGMRLAEAVRADQPLRELGLDSLLAVELRNRISDRIGARLPATLLFDHPTPARLTDHLLNTVLAVKERTVARTVTVRAPAQADEPVAIVSMACRLPGGVTDPDGLWRLLEEGRDAVGPFPADRWDVEALYDPDPEAPGKTYAREGGFLEDLDLFDAAFFGITPKEAAAMDPQQRLLLETAWESLERAGSVPGDLAGSATGVYIGLFDSGYLAEARLDQMDGYFGTGSAPSVASGRLAYALGLHGPAMTVDTACSSSLVALHLAAQALRLGECDLALAGGATLMVTPRTFVEFSRLRGLSPTGRCRSFADDADGAVWAEGVGMVVLKRLSDARLDGNEILAVIRGTAVNQDGRSQGLSAPNGPAQEKVIRRALELSGLGPSDIDYVEAHGTGTTLGDPIEANALAGVFGAASRLDDRPLYLGSLKSNIGHAQAASGIAGLIKVVQSLRHGLLPRTLHVDTPSRHVEWDGSGLELLREPVAWPRSEERVRRAGLSSFGISGTNAHVIVQEAPVAEVAHHGEVPSTLGLFALSARTDTALRAQAARLAGHITAGADPRDVAYTLARHRSHFERRAALIAGDRDELLARLDELVSGPMPAHPRNERSGKLAFVFPGHGGQWAGMGLELMAESPVFREELERIDEAVRRHAGWSVLDVLRDETTTGGGKPTMDRTEVLQPMLFAVNAALAAAWRALGVTPDAVVGHSLGEITAAYGAGALALDEAVTVVTGRARAAALLEGEGGMLSVDLPHEETERRLVPFPGRLFVAAVNSPSSTAVSGEAHGLAELRRQLDAEGIAYRTLSTPFASHTPLMAPVSEELLAALTEVRGTRADVALYSTVRAEPVPGDRLDAAYWYANLSQPVRFADTIRRMLDDGYRHFVELSPHPSLGPSIEAVAAAGGVDAVSVGSLHRTHGGHAQLVRNFAKLYASGYDPDWSVPFPGGVRTDLPTYPFARERHWLSPAPALPAGAGPGSPLLDTHVEPSDSSDRHVFQTHLDLRHLRFAYLSDHRIGGEVWLPGAAFLEMALSAAARLQEGGEVRLADVRFEAPLRLEPETAVDLQLVLGRADADGARDFTIASRTSGPCRGPWTRHAGGRTEPGATKAVLQDPGLTLATLREHCTTAAEVSTVYAALAAAGIDYGPAFQGLAEGLADRSMALGRLIERPHFGHLLHPAVLDAAFHVAALPADAPTGRLFVPAGLGRLRFTGTGTTPVWTACRLRSHDGDKVTLDICLFDAEERPVLEIEAFELAALSPLDRALMELRWQPARRTGTQRPPARGSWLVLTDDTGVGAELADLLGTVPHVVVRKGTEYGLDGSGRYVIDPGDPQHLVRLLDEAFPAEQPEQVVQLFGLDAPAIVSAETAEDAAQLCCLSTLHLVRALTERSCEARTQGSRGRAPRLFLVTRGSQAAGGSAEVAYPQQALGWGFGLAVAQEYPELRTTLIDLPSDPSDGATNAVTTALWHELSHPDDDETLLALRGGERLVPRLARTRPDTDTDTDPTVAEGTYLITGGLGGLARVAAERLVDRGVRRLALLSRSVPDTDAERWMDGLREHGVTVVHARADVTNRDRLTEALAGLRRDLGPIDGIVHTAGVLDDATLPNLTRERVLRVLAPKVLGTAFVTELVPEARVSVLFSSIAGVLGSPGQSHYSAANAFLDAWAHHQSLTGRPALSLAWGAWADTGMAAATDVATEISSRQGLIGFSSEEGGELFDRVLGTDRRQLVPAALDWTALGADPTAARTRPSLRDLVTAREPNPGARDMVARVFAARTEDEQTELLQDYVRTAVGAVAGGIADIGPGTALKELGLDSLLIVHLRNTFLRDLGADLPTSAVFSAADVRSLATALRTTLIEQGGSAATRRDLAPPRADTALPDTDFRPVTRDVVRLLRTAQQGVPGVAHAIGLAVRLTTPTTPERLTEVVTRLAARHAALRTAVATTDGRERRLRLDREPAGSLLRWTDLSETGEEFDVDRRLRELLEEPFDLATAPLWRFELLDGGTAHGQVLVFGAHHAVSDLQSLLLVTGEIDAELSGVRLDGTATNRDIDLLLTAQPDRVNGRGTDAVAAEWRREFDGIKRLELTLTRPRPESRTYRSGSLTLDMPEGLMRQVTACAGRLAVTPAAFCLGTLTVLLARKCRREKFVLAVPVDTRIHVDAPAAIGFFGVPVPFPAQATPGEPIAETLRRTDGRLERVLEKGAMFSDALSELAVQGLYQPNAPLVEVYFNYVRVASAKLSALEVLPAGTGYSDVDLMVTVTPDVGRVRLDHNLDIINAEDGAALGNEYLRLLAEAAADPEAVTWQAEPETGTTTGATTRVGLAATFALGDLPIMCEAALGDATPGDGTVTVSEAPYHQVLAALKDPSGVFARSTADLGVVLLRGTDLERFQPVDDALLAELRAEYAGALRSVAERTGNPLIVGFLPVVHPDERLERWAAGLAADLVEVPGIAVVHPDDWTREHAVNERFDSRTEELAHLPFTPEFQAVVALTLADVVEAVHRTTPKVIAVDGDETLWSGIAGEVGPDSVDLGGPRALLARRLLQWRAAGALLVLVSNNDEATVQAVLDRPDSLLRREHFNAVSASWGRKADRLAEAARELNLGLDSFLYLDDNPVEIASMRAALPQVFSVTCPPAADLETFLRRLWPLVPGAATAEDVLRAEFYRTERDRDAVREQASFEEFLDRLELEVGIRPLSDDGFARAEQLIRRINQFTLSARSADGGDLDRLRERGEVWTASARDRFGDYGQIGLLAVRPDGDTLDVLAWMLSCRALGRGVEERLLQWLADHAAELGCTAVRLSAEHTPRNLPARRLVAALGGGLDADAGRLEAVVDLYRLREFKSWRV